MWGHFTSELQNGVETLKEDWKKIRANVKNADVSDFKEYEKKELKLSTKDYTASLQKIVELTALLCSATMATARSWCAVSSNWLSAGSKIRLIIFTAAPLREIRRSKKNSSTLLRATSPQPTRL